MKRGKIAPNGVVLEKHEIATVVFLTELGFYIELIPPNRTKGVRTPDFKMRGLEWEMKSPVGKSRLTLEHAFHAGLRQSENLIFDLRRLNPPTDKHISALKSLFVNSKRAKRLLIIATINKNDTLIDIHNLL
jgi:hypothetical protein